MTFTKNVLSGKVYSFPRGGILYTDTNVPSRESFETAYLPSLSVIPLENHSGTGRAYPVVSVGEQVKEGMLIARGRGPGSANIHATVPGRVIRIVSYRSAGGHVQNGIVIRLEGCFEKLGRREEVYSWEGMFHYDIQRTISEFGVVEMEGKGRPVSEMISAFRSTPEPNTLVVRCVFDDPWLAADYVLCKERAADVVEGAVITARCSKVSKIIYAISQGERELGERFVSAGAKWGIPANTVLVGSRYPQRNQRELELVLRNYEKKEGVELGSLLILGPATLAAVYDAVRKRKPPVERFITVGGSAVRQPKVMKVRIGKRIGDIFDECGGFKGNPKRIAIGSPLLGRPVLDLDEPVAKTSYAVFALLEGFRRGEPEIRSSSSCIGCGECRNVCPVGLDPEELYKRVLLFSKGVTGGDISPDRSPECHGCACCEVVCPSALPLSASLRAVHSGGHSD